MNISRRQALKWFTVMGALAASPFGLPTGFARAAKTYGEGEQSFHSACTVNCGSSCFLKAVVKDGKLVRIETDPSADSPANRANRACLRGRSMRQLT